MTGQVDPSPWEGRRVLVTGHTGFKGGWLTIWLAGMGADVTGLALPPNTEPNLFEAAGVAECCRHVEGDVRDADAVARAVREADPEVVFHLAAQPLVRESYKDPVGTLATNVMGAAHVLEAVRGCASTRVVVVITTDKCYENREWCWGYREGDALGGHDPYSGSKAAVEIVCAAYRRSFLNTSGGTALSTARAGNVIGGGDWAADRLVPDAMRAFADGAPVRIRNPRATRPWQHVIEPLRGYLLLAEATWSAGPASGAAYNFGPKDIDVVSVGAVMDRLTAGWWGDKARWEHASPDRDAPHEAGLLKLDCSRAAADLGWVPRTNLEQGLAATVEWYRAFYGGADPASIRELCDSQIRALGMASP